MTAALFDLDQTLLPYDTQALFCNYVIRQQRWRRLYPLTFAPALPLKVLRLINTRALKRAYHSYLWGMKVTRLRELAEGFVHGVLPPLFYPSVLAELERHRAEGRTLILTTASPDIYAGLIAGRLRFDHWFATPMQMPSWRMPLYPRILGENNKNTAKLRSMAHLLPKDEVAPLGGWYAYSDSVADLPILRLAEHAVTVNPDAGLEEIALHEGWRIMRPGRPQGSAWGFRAECVRQSLGLWRAGGDSGAGDGR